ncbi:MAG TPA: hypothetical protein HPQ00_03365 [Magnetococcales bacterium]|nr:hypothetical protein [Magnetococcales bacterium]
MSALTLNYGFGETPVFIDQRYRPGGCPYREILAHENAHVAILDQEGKEIQRWLERKLTSLVTSIPPTPTRSPKTTQQQWMAKIDRETKPLLETLKKRLETAHARLDSPPSLAKTQKQCPKW